MCKYCSFNKKDEHRYNAWEDFEIDKIASVGKVWIGNELLLELEMFRSKTRENTEECDASMMMSLSAFGEHDLKHKTIKIKYCPFCGTKLV